MKSDAKSGDGFKDTSTGDEVMKGEDSSSSIPEDLGYPTDIEDSGDDRQYLHPKNITSTRMKSDAKSGDGFKDTCAQEEVMKGDDSSSSIPEDLGYPTDIEDSGDDRQYLHPKNVTSTRMKSDAKSGDRFNNDNDNVLLRSDNNNGMVRLLMELEDITLDDKHSLLESTADPNIITTHNNFYNNPSPPERSHNISHFLEDIENIISYEEEEFENYSARTEDNNTSLTRDNDNDKA